VATVHQADDVNTALICPSRRQHHTTTKQTALKAICLRKVAASEIHTSTHTNL
jgi:hypothetical protein